MVLFVCSLVVKLLGVVYMNRYLAWNLVAPDTRGVYRPLALNLVSGGGYQLNGDAAGATRIAPGFPLYLSAVYRVFGVDAPVRLLGILNALMRSAVTCLVYVLALRAFGAIAALFAGAVHALDPWEAFWSAFVLKESLAVLLSITAIVLVSRALDKRSAALGVCAGLAIALASLTRYATLGLFAWTLLLVAWCSVRGMFDLKSAAKLAVAVTLGALVGLSPWLIRNRAALGVPVVYTQLGYYLYVSNGPGTEKRMDTWGYSGLSSPDAAGAAAIASGHHGVIDRDAAFFRESIVHSLSYPATTATLVAARFVNMWRPTFEGSSLANVVVLGGFFCLFALVAVAGIAIGRHAAAPGGESTALVLYWAFLYYLLLHTAFWSEIRYRQYVTPLLAVFAGLALARSCDRFASRPRAD